MAANKSSDTIQRSTVKLDIRYVKYIPHQILDGRQPRGITNQHFEICNGNVELEATLNKRIFQQDERIPVNISIQNNSNKVVKKIKITAHQTIDLLVFSKSQYKRSINKSSSKKGCPIMPGSSLRTVLYVTPSLFGNKRTHGIALDGNLKKDESKLAPTTAMEQKDKKDTFGIAVSYSIKVKLFIAPLHNVILANLPFVLLHS